MHAIHGWMLILLIGGASAKTVSFTLTATDVVCDYWNPHLGPLGITPSDQVYNPETMKLCQLLAVDSGPPQYPGPPIEVDEGDTLSITVVNLLQDSALSIHWHGMYQNRTCEMDGVPWITQCEIMPSGIGTRQTSQKTYTFKAYPPGTFWYHSHVMQQREKGIQGPLIVHAKQDHYRDTGAYQQERVVTFGDWWHDPVADLAYNGAPGVGANPVTYQLPFTLINGQWGNGTAELPYPTISVQAGVCYRFRFINMNGETVGNTVSINGHNMTIIATDGVELKPLLVNSFAIYNGERVDAIVCANQPIGSYLITISTYRTNTVLQDPRDGQRHDSYVSYAFLQYDTAPVASVENNCCDDFLTFCNSTNGTEVVCGGQIPPGIGGPPPRGTGGGTSTLPNAGVLWDYVASPFRAEPFTAVSIIGQPAYRFNWSIDVMTFPHAPNSNSPDPYTTLGIANYSFRFPHSPLLYTKGTCGAVTEPDFPQLTTRINSIPTLGSVVQISLFNSVAFGREIHTVNQSQYGFPHPFHLHSFYMHIVGIGRPNDGPWNGDE
eukprot:TRINITY_DN4521_c0_g1_i1.p1 TRINITY_DN4521_c0_g1~~TRINITY_DN4521_c0_g1_i1.p1  ORF type:complete len:549 (+),score=83.57 TRINITY_DN4521_c0_g1_i1:59-1705(+)